MGEAKFLQDVVHSIGLDLLARPGLESDSRLQMPGLALEYSPVTADGQRLLVSILILGPRGLVGGALSLTHHGWKGENIFRGFINYAKCFN